ncbi:hypothetical protein MYX76_14230 [Desulfobacterota bacterium AH_259_B03_O07]|nr:hypothetical protein [Desulfobacterota bacterium AH_259_B03_O07]
MLVIGGVDRMELKKHSYTITEKMQSLPVTSEAKLLYLSNCEMQDDYIKEQQDNGVDPPKIKLDNIHTYMYRENNELTQRDMVSIVEELREIGVLDED